MIIQTGMRTDIPAFYSECLLNRIEEGYVLVRNPYKKVERNFPTARAVSKKDRITIGKAFVEIAGRYGMTIRPCAEGNELEEYGADCSGCMTVHTFETALHNRLDVPKRKNNQRNGEYAGGTVSMRRHREVGLTVSCV